MRRVEKVVNGNKYITETYDNVYDLLHTLESRKYKKEVRNPTKDDDDTRFYEVSHEEAVKMLKYGYEGNIREVIGNVKNMEKQGTVAKTSFKNDIVGYAPIVPNAILGIPQSMINNVRVPKKAKVVTLLVDMSVKATVRPIEVRKFGNQIVEKVMQLEKSGFRVRLESAKVTNEENGIRGEHVCMSMVIKDEHQPLDLKRIMFPLTHVAFQRRIAFEWYEKLPDAKFSYGHGVSLSVLDRAERKEIIKNLVGDTSNKYVICFGDNLDEVLKEVR